MRRSHASRREAGDYLGTGNCTGDVCIAVGGRRTCRARAVNHPWPSSATGMSASYQAKRFGRRSAPDFAMVPERPRGGVRCRVLFGDAPSSLRTSPARRSGKDSCTALYSALSTFPSAESNGCRLRRSGRADGFRIGRSLRDTSYEGGPTKASELTDYSSRS